MSRLYKDSNTRIFQLLDQTCSAQGLSVSNAGNARWITSETKHKHFMAHAVVQDILNLSSFRKLVKLEHSGNHFICSFGFIHHEEPVNCAAIPTEASHLTVLLAESAVRPAASVPTIKNIVEFSDQESDGSYNGHDPELIASLFPPLQIYSIDPSVSQHTWSIFFKYCLYECEFVGSWLDSNLREELFAISDLDPLLIPYKILCRSVLDGDPSIFFLSLYRCLEANYSYASAERLKTKLSISNAWTDIAIALEDTLGWRPQEQGSLEGLFQFADVEDLKKLILYISGAKDEGDVKGLPVRAAKLVYWLRNNIVHYRPLQRIADIEALNWCRICEALAATVFHVYNKLSHTF